MFNQSEQPGFVKGTRRSAWRNSLLAACAWLAFLGATKTSRGQCLVEHVFASDGAAGDLFGYSVAIDGDTAILSAVTDDATAGSAYIFVRSGGVWTEQAHLFAAGGLADDQMGYSVAIDGDTAVVGANRDDTSAGANAGSAFVFVRDNNGVWTQQAQLFASDGAANDIFGTSVAISGDTVVVGAPRDNTLGGTQAGSAYVFKRNGVVWTQQDHLFASDGAAFDWFSGFDVAISGDTIVVGAYLDDTQGGADAGSAYVFVRSGVAWTEQAHLYASDGATNEQFGRSLAISGETAVVGARGIYPPDGTHTGSAYVFVRSEDVWTEQDHLFASDAAVDDNFGFSVDITGDTIVVGAPVDDTLNGTDAGSVYSYVRSGVVWTERAHLFAFDGAADDWFGFDVDISGNTAVVGAIVDDTLAGTDAGSAYVFDLGCTPGDLNCDSAVDLADVPHFIDALMASGSFSGCDINRADMNADGLIDGRDTAAFAAELVGA